MLIGTVVLLERNENDIELTQLSFRWLRGFGKDRFDFAAAPRLRRLCRSCEYIRHGLPAKGHHNQHIKGYSASHDSLPFILYWPLHNLNATTDLYLREISQ
jgi:hypothetical protein